MTNELPEGVIVNEFYCGGPKFYLLSGWYNDYDDDDDDNNNDEAENAPASLEEPPPRRPFNVFKLKGITMNQESTTTTTTTTSKGNMSVGCINSEQIRRLVMGQVDVLYTPFSYISRNSKTAQLTNKSCLKTSRQTSNKRLFNTANGTSVPFGWR